MLVLKWVSVTACRWMDLYLFSRCDGESMSLHWCYIYHLKLVQNRRIHVTCVHCLGIIKLVQRKHDICWYLAQIICLKCWCLLPKIWYAYNYIGYSIVWSVWPWWITMSHKVLNGCQSLVNPTVVTIVGKLGLRVHSWCFGWWWSVYDYHRLRYYI